MGSNPDISQKYKMGDISKGVDNTLQSAYKIISPVAEFIDPVFAKTMTENERLGLF